jgi:hypothetical protein
MEEAKINEKLVGVEEAAELLGHTPHVIYRLVARRKIPFRSPQLPIRMRGQKGHDTGARGTVSTYPPRYSKSIPLLGAMLHG